MMDPVSIGAAMALFFVGAVGKKLVSAKIAEHLCGDVCKEKFVLDPEKRWRCSKECKRQFKNKITIGKDKYKYLRQKKDYSPDEESK